MCAYGGRMNVWMLKYMDIHTMTGSYLIVYMIDRQTEIDK